MSGAWRPRGAAKAAALRSAAAAASEARQAAGAVRSDARAAGRHRGERQPSCGLGAPQSEACKHAGSRTHTRVRCARGARVCGTRRERGALACGEC